ncbi:MAG: iron ABC transporter permease, partial [Gammaproteobacteria bacterium]|nr:iron ABC transporter permease [Gammaproteobacteria bacterium]
SALGINVAQSRWVLIAAATLMTACAVSFSGIVGWVGLLVPHIARLWVGPNMSRLLPFSIVLGASFVLLTDTLARSVSELELPLGVLTALLGGPFFLFVLLRSNRP